MFPCDDAGSLVLHCISEIVGVKVALVCRLSSLWDSGSAVDSYGQYICTLRLA